jgi:hypothetical protein
MTCGQTVAELPRYYARQIITPDDMTLEQEYFRSRLRQHNRLLHGWGVVCGLEVCLVPKANGNNGSHGQTAGEQQNLKAEPWKVAVKPGFALSPCGDEISVDCRRVFDLRTRSLTGITGEACLDAPDPWCSEVFEQRDANPLYVAVKYKEIATRPVRVQPTGCGCDDTSCEYSRRRDGYEIGVLTSRPESCDDPPEGMEFNNMYLPPCPTRPDDLWVVLAEVELGDNGDIKRINNCSCRRMVLSFAEMWWKCKEKETETVEVKPVPLPEGRTNPEVEPPEKEAAPSMSDSTESVKATAESVKTTAEAAAPPPAAEQTPPAKKRRRKEPDEEI